LSEKRRSGGGNKDISFIPFFGGHIGTLFLFYTNYISKCFAKGFEGGKRNMIHSPRRLRSIVPVFFTRRKIGKGVPAAAGKKDC